MKTYKLIVIIVLLLFFAGLQGRGQTAISFIENKKQWEEVIKFKSEMRNGAVFFEKNAITYHFCDPEFLEKVAALKSQRLAKQKSVKPLDSLVEYYAYRVCFENANKNTVIEGLAPFEEYHNYYLDADPERWSVNVRKYARIEYCQLYKGINLTFFEDAQTYKYEFKVAPEADAEQIVMRYEGADKLQLKKGILTVKVGKHETEERKPFAYQKDVHGNRVEIPCEYVLDGKTVRFSLGKYDKSKELIIDPSIIFSTFSGSTMDNWGYTATYDNHKNLYGGGTVHNDYGGNYPITLGCYQSVFKGGGDIAITKFNPTGTARLFSTYLGGKSVDVPHSMIVNNDDELYVLATTSSPNYPVTANAYDRTFHGGQRYDLVDFYKYDSGVCIVVSRFNAAGTQLLSSTFFGGNGIDGLSTDVSLKRNYSDEVRGEIQLDAVGNVYIVSSTSSTNLPTTNGAFQRNYGGGTQDGCIAKFSYNLQNLIWCSYLGGSSADAIYSMVLDKNNNMYLCGGTTSANFPITLGSIQTRQPGGVDGFVSTILNGGGRILNSTYYGRSGYDQTYLINLDKAENVYVMGQTDTAASTWIRNAAWSSGRGQFVSKLSKTLSNVIWSTSFGSSDSIINISPTALMVDICGNVHISGWGSDFSRGHPGSPVMTVRGMPVSNDAWYPTTMDGNDFYFITIEKDASNLLFASFFGGSSSEHVDGGTSRFDKKGIIYQAVCAGCSRESFPTMPPNVVAPNNGSRNCNLGVIKIDYNLQSVVADFALPNTTCAPINLTFTNLSQTFSNRVTYFWDFGDNRTSTYESPVIPFTKSGTYKIRLIVTDSAACNVSDTIEKELIVLASERHVLPTITVCPNESHAVGVPPTSGMTYRWTPTVGLSNYNISNPMFQDNVSRQYTLYISNGSCTDTFTQQVNMSAFPAGQQRTIYGCQGDTLQLNADTTGSADYFIFSNYPNFIDTLNSPLSASYIDISLDNNTKTYYVFRRGECKATDTIIVNAASFAIALDTAPHLCSGDTARLAVTVQNPIYSANFSYKWTPASAIMGSASIAKPLAKPTDSTFMVVTVKDEYGCTQKDSVLVRVSHIQIPYTQNNISCHGLTDGSISINTWGGISPYKYVWSDTSLKNNIVTNLAKGTYTAKITDKLNCSLTQTFTITEPEKLFIHLEDTVALVFCDSASMGRALAVGTGGVQPYRFQWISGDTTPLIEGLYAGTYFVTLYDKNGCKDTVTFNVRDTSDMEVQYSSREVTCYGVCDGNALIQIITAASPYTILWKTGEKVPYRDSLCAGFYDVLVTDYQQCRRRVFPEVPDVERFNVNNLKIVHPYCFGMKDGSISLNISGGNPPYRYFWDGVEGGNVLSDLTKAGQYRLHITDRKDCEFDTIFTLPPYDTLSKITRATDIPCSEACVGKAEIQVFGGVAPYYYHWSDDEADMPQIDSLCEGTYSVFVLDSNNCRIEAEVHIGIKPLLPDQVRAWADTTEIYRTQSVTLYGTDLGVGFTYEWSPEEGLSSTKGTKVRATPKDSIIYLYTVTDKYGCQKSDTLFIAVKDVFCIEPYLFVPNSFTPNGDGHNDILYVNGLTLTEIDFAIYNRWGERVFATTDPKMGWDGTYKGKDCEPAVYVYYLTATCIGGEKYVKKGNITLMK